MVCIQKRFDINFIPTCSGMQIVNEIIPVELGATLVFARMRHADQDKQRWFGVREFLPQPGKLRHLQPGLKSGRVLIAVGDGQRVEVQPTQLWALFHKPAHLVGWNIKLVEQHGNLLRPMN